MIERMYATDIAEDALILDFSRAPSYILSNGEAFGYAYLETLHHLDIATHRVSEQGIILSGHSEQIRSCAVDLKQHIGSIARCGAERARFNRREAATAIAGVISQLTDEIIPDIVKRDTFYLLATAITWPFAKAANNSGDDLYLLPGEALTFHGHEGYAARRQSAIDSFLTARKGR